MTRAFAFSAVVLLVAVGCGSGSVRGGSGIVTAGLIGSLRIDVSTRAAIVAFAGKPDFTSTGELGRPGVPKYLALGYRCTPSGPSLDAECQAVYYMNARTHRLAAFYTKSPSFHTTNGITPGMAQDAADRLEHQTPHGPWNAIGDASPSPILILPSTCHRVRSGRCSGNVEGFMLESRHHPIGLSFT